MNIQNVAHRGASALAPENTLRAFKKALEIGADAIEMDVRLSQDEILVVIHDETLKAVSKGKERRSVHEINYSEMKPYGIPSLEEVLDTLVNKIGFHIEIKHGRKDKRDIAKNLVDLLARKKALSKVLVTSFHKPYLDRVKKLERKIRTGLLLHPWRWLSVAQAAKTIKKLKLSILLFHARSLSKRPAHRLTKKRIPFGLWGVGRHVDRMKKALSLGAQCAINDAPDQFRKLIRNRTQSAS